MICCANVRKKFCKGNFTANNFLISQKIINFAAKLRYEQAAKETSAIAFS